MRIGTLALLAALVSHEPVHLGGTGMTSSGTAGSVLVSDGTTWQKGLPNGDLSANTGLCATCFKVAGIQTFGVSAATPSTGQSLVWNGSNYVPTDPQVPLARMVSGTFDSGFVTLSSTALVTLVSTTLTTGTDVFIHLDFEADSSDSIHNLLTFGESTNTTASIVNAFSLTSPVSDSTSPWGGISEFAMTKLIHLGSLTPGSNTFNILISAGSTPGASRLTVRASGDILY